MKQAKKLLAIVLLATISLGVGCTNGANQDVTNTPANESTVNKGDDTQAQTPAENTGDTADTANKEIVAGETIEGEGFTAVVPEGWKKLDMTVMEGAISLYKSQTDSMNLVMMDAAALGDISIEDYKAMVEENFEQQKSMGITVDKVELKTMPYGDVIYVEAQTKMTQELIDASLESGLLTQEALDSIGGAQEYIKNMSMGQVCIYHLVNGKIYMITAQSQGGTAADVADAALFVAENTTF